MPGLGVAALALEEGGAACQGSEESRDQGAECECVRSLGRAIIAQRLACCRGSRRAQS